MEKITMNQWKEWHELGDVVVVEELIELNQDHEHLYELENDCFRHEYYKENGETYDNFKDRFIEITKKYVENWED